MSKYNYFIPPIHLSCSIFLTYIVYNSYMSSLSDLDPQAKTSITSLIDSLFREYQSNLSTILGKIDNNGIVTYVVIIFIAIFFAKIIDVSLTFIFLLIVGLFFCYLIYK